MAKGQAAPPPVLRLEQRVPDVGDGQVGEQVLVLLAGLAVAPQHICRPANSRLMRGEEEEEEEG